MTPDLERWNRAAEDWHEKIARDGSYRTHLIADAMQKLLPDLRDKEALDAGCGNGYFSKWMTDRGAHVKGLDGSEEMAKLARASYPGIKFAVADLTKPITGENQKYDFIVANMLLMHMDRISTFLAECRRLLKPEGRLVFSVLHPCFNRPTARLYKSLWHKLTLAKPRALAYDYYASHSGRYETHMGSNLTHYHRTLEEYSKELAAAGLAIAEIIEPHDLPKDFLKLHPKLEYAQRLPRFIFFNCIPL